MQLKLVVLAGGEDRVYGFREDGLCAALLRLSQKSRGAFGVEVGIFGLEMGLQVFGSFAWDML